MPAGEPHSSGWGSLPERPRGRVVKVDIERSPDLAARYGVKSLPSLLVFKEGRVVSRQSGVADKARLHSLLDL
jgi:thioredoxin-like negative regulator of GroEL